LHREACDDIRYFQNELTNVESRQLAFNAAMHGSCRGSWRHVVHALCDTERNFPLKKDETTVGLERERMGSALPLGVVRQVGRILRPAKAGSGN
jgi:hypothetical protein